MAWYTRILATYGPLGPGHNDAMAIVGAPGFAMEDKPVFVLDGLRTDGEAMQSFILNVEREGQIPKGAKYRVERVWVSE